MDIDRTTALAAAAGIFDLGFAFFHVAFWRVFRWPRTLRASGDVNSAITQTLNVMLTYCLGCAGVWLVATAVRGSPPPTPLLLAAGGFWLLRAGVQPLLFGVRHPISAALAVLFALGGALHLAAAV